MTLYFPEILNGEDKSSQLTNTIRNHYRHIRKWAKRTNTDCFRIYDRDIPQYPVAIDFYSGRFCIHYFATNQFGPLSDSFKLEVEDCLMQLFGTKRENIYWRTRQKTKETRQYEKRGDTHLFFVSTEYGVKFNINLEDYLDTGLFLDHRETRQIVANLCKDKRLLNLFAYTCSFSVHAAMAGASFTKSVDLSNTYTQWGRENFKLNHINETHHPIIRADCLKFLDSELLCKEKYDIIVIDPPTISRSKKMEGLFDIQIDYVALLKKSLQLLLPQGVIFFSTNSRKFRFEETLFPHCVIQDISSKTTAKDIHRSDNHACWKISMKN